MEEEDQFEEDEDDLDRDVSEEEDFQRKIFKDNRFH